ncbi:hypothetical protein LH464_05375 [Neorhizobium sp. T786]|uniref:hypothetical protein n=1 Tax=Pseudorhizobium xiangyangii TaxID=2883104 RepID=UPI001D0012A1|nr:hypothetical protein [Neorhizobium xiangyangii]MCB5201909.1 hypothetical protein [Neorhizobium xiangyangii]
MKTASYNPVRVRNIPLELAQLQRERGTAMTRSEFKALGYTDDHLSEATIAKAAETFSRLENREAA